MTSTTIEELDWEEQFEERLRLFAEFITTTPTPREFHRRLTAETAFIHQLLLSQLEEVEREVIGEDVRHITDTKGIQNVVDLNEGNVSWDEVVNEVQKEIDAQNLLRAKQRSKLSTLRLEAKNEGK